ncbi:MAG: hypothetical protein ACON4O_03905 [Lentimonas sp.]
MPPKSLLSTITFVACTISQLTAELPPEAIEAKAQLELAFETAKLFPHEIRMQVNMKEDFLYSITIAEEVGTIEGTKKIPIPAELIPIWPLFRQINIHGVNTGSLYAEQITPSYEGEMERWWSNDAMIVLHAHNLKIEADKTEGYFLVLEGSATVGKVELVNSNGISPIFDDSPYTTLGADKPIKPVTLTIDARTLRSIEGICEFDTTKFFRLYTEPCRDPAPVREGFREFGFVPGRQILKFAPWLEGGYVEDQPLLEEDPLKPGYADPEYFTNHNPDLFRSEIERGFDAYKDIETDWPGLKFIMCFDNWPSFMEAKAEGVHNSKGTPHDYDAAADIASKLLAAQQKYSGRTPDWIEVKNESDIADEWMYHDVKGVDSWKELAHFHNVVADRIHRDFDHIKVGGPTSVWPMYDNANFTTAREQLRFMENTKGHLDFYSHHFYEGKGLISKKQFNTGGVTYVHGRGDAVLDLTANHMLLNNNIRPLVISEYGAIHGGMKDMDFWIRLKSCNALQLMFMNRTHLFELCVPYMLPYMWWDPSDPYGIYTRNPDGSFEATKTISFLRLWQGYQGKRVVNSSNADDFVAHSLLDGDTLWVAANNLSDQRVALNLDLLLGTAEVRSIEQRRLYFDSGKLVENTVLHPSDSEAIPLAVDETSVIKIKLDRAPQTVAQLNENYFYGDQVMVPTGEAVNYTLSCPTEQLQSATLRVGIGKNGGFRNKLEVTIGDHSQTIDLAHTYGMQRYYDLIELQLPTEKIQSKNTVTLHMEESGGQITSVTLRNVYKTN